MSIIEKATKRLEELRRSGIEVPWSTPGEPVDSARRDAPAIAAPVAISGARRAKRARKPVESTVEEPSSRQLDIDFTHLSKLGMLDPTAPRSRLADELRVIKRPIIANARGTEGAETSRSNLVMVTSTVPGEGKSFMSINLALSIAMEFDGQVLLVDADTIRPAVLDRLGLPPGLPGLLDRLVSPSKSLADVILRTNIEKLAILPPGTSNPNATEMLASAAMDQFLDEISARYPDRIIIFDAPPLLPSTEARVLATRMGQVVLVIEAGRTTQSMLKQSLATLEACPVVMTLLNKWRGFGGALAGYSYYGY